MAIIKKGDNIIDVIYKGAGKDSEPTQYGAYNIDVVITPEGTQELHITDAVEKPMDMLQWKCDNLNTLAYEFYGADLTNVDLSIFDGLNTSKVTNAERMFSGAKLSDIFNLDTSAVTNMKHMFTGLKKASGGSIGEQTLDELTKIEKFNVGNVTHMNYMFNNAWIKKIDLSEWNTKNLTDMNSMFKSCIYTNELNVSNFNVDNVTDMSYMFDSCYVIPNLDLSEWNTEKVKNMNGMFSGCSKLTDIGNISNWNTSNVTTMYEMFRGCTALQTLDLSNWDVSKVTTTGSMFAGSGIVNLDLSNWDTSKVKTMTGMFNNMPKLTVILGTLDLISATTVTNMLSVLPLITTFTIKNLKKSLTIGSGTRDGTLLDDPTVINTAKELWDLTGSTSQTLQVSTPTNAKFDTIYVKLITATDEMIANDPNINSKKPCEVCASTDEGAMTLREYIVSKNWTIAK